jgi:hypothetical protein
MRRSPIPCLPASQQQSGPHAKVAVNLLDDHRRQKPVRLGAHAVALKQARTPM